MFKKKKTSVTAPTTPESSLDAQSLMYIRAKHEWDERIGSAVKSAHSWKIMAFLAIIVGGGAVAGISHIGSQSKIQPYGIVLQGDKVIPAGPMDELKASQLKNMKVSELRHFIEDIRSVYIDVNAQKKSITAAYAYLRPGDPAHQQITTTFKKLSPFKRAETELVKVKIGTVLPLSEDTYQAEWTETLTSPTGQSLGESHFKATMNTYQLAPTTNGQIQSNPLGFFIKTFNDVQVN
jgi:type IV secretion system protein VirB5